MKPQRFAMIPALGFLAFAEYWDAVTSRYFPLHTTGEANWISRGEDGYYSLKKSMAVTIVVSVVLTLCAYLLPHPAQYVVAGMTSIIAAVIFFAIVQNNRKKQKEDRAKQADYLEHFTSVSPTSIKAFKGEWVLPTFYDIRVPILGPTSGSDGALEMVRAALVLTAMFLVLKANPQLWWDLNRAKKVKELMARV
jgi:esterase/lipase